MSMYKLYNEKTAYSRLVSASILLVVMLFQLNDAQKKEKKLLHLDCCALLDSNSMLCSHTAPGLCLFLPKRDC